MGVEACLDESVLTGSLVSTSDSCGLRYMYRIRWLAHQILGHIPLLVDGSGCIVGEMLMIVRSESGRFIPTLILRVIAALTALLNGYAQDQLQAGGSSRGVQ